MHQSIRKSSPFLAVALTASLLFGSCIGPFSASHHVLHWNRSVVQNKWAAEGIFLGLAILPVYALAAGADAIVFNSWEFWAGKPLIPAAPYSADGTIEPKKGEVSTDPGPIEVTPIEQAD